MDRALDVMRGWGSRRLAAPALFALAGLGLLLAAAVHGGADAPGTFVLAQATTPEPPRLVLAGVSRDGPLPTPTATNTPTPTPMPPPRPASPAGARLWTNGDSTSYFMSSWLMELLGAQGAVPVQGVAEYKISSGLLSPGYFNWPAYLASQMDAYDPDIVVFMVGANDAHPGMDLERYRGLVGSVMDQLRREGRVVAWVGQPIMGPNRPDLNAAIPGMNRIFAEEAEQRPWVVYVDAWSLTTDANGDYAEALPDESGAWRTIRTGDGVHFTSEGGRRLALGVIAALFP